MLKNRPMEAGGVFPDMAWTDSHCHLDSLDSAPREAVAHAFEAGVTEILNVGTDPESSAASVQLAGKSSSVWAVVGVHPHEARHVDDGVLRTITDLASHPRVVAIGEIGLDFFRDHSPRDKQVEAFERQLEIAARLEKPVVLHIREAMQEVFRVLEAAQHTAGLIFHCFSGGPEEAERAVAMGAYVSFAGNISYKKSELLRQAARRVPLNRLLVETDAPYLAPMPHRGKPNHPALVPEVGRAVAEATGCSIAEVAVSSRANAREVFRLDSPF